MTTLAEHLRPVGKWNPGTAGAGYFCYIDLASVDQHAKQVTRWAQIQHADAPSRARQLIKAGDILVSTVRPNLNAVAIVPEELDGATASTGFSVLRPSSSLDRLYLFHWVRSPQFVGEMVRQATGASYPAVSDRIVKNSQIPLPPLSEQRRVATVLTEADALRAKRRRSLALLDDLRAAQFDEIFGDPLSGQWDAVELGDVVDTIENGASPNCEARPAEPHEWGVLKLGAVTYGKFRANENKAYLGEIDSMSANEVRAGDVLMTRKNTPALVGAVAVVGPDVRPHLLLPDLIFRLKLDAARVEPAYFQALMMSRRIRSAVRGLASGSAASMPNISKARLRTLRLGLPPYELQATFARSVAAIAAQGAVLRRSHDVVDQLFASIQSSAFSGNLAASAG